MAEPRETDLPQTAAAIPFGSVRVQPGDFDVGAELAALRAGNPKIGALTCFVGTVRDLSDGMAVDALELEHYPGMTERALTRIVEQAGQRWPLAGALVIHRVGRLLPTEQIVLVAVTAAHRGVAFDACEFIIDYLKTAAPFWKKEGTGADSRWVDARVADDEAVAKWGIALSNAGSAGTAESAESAGSAGSAESS